MRPARALRNQPAPDSQVRPVAPRIVPAPPPPEETSPVRSDPAAAIRAAREADEYAALRVRLAEIDAEKKELEARLVEDMKRAGKTRFSTEHGLVSFLAATVGGEIVDEAAAVALLESRGLPQPPTLEEWLRRHELDVPKKVKKGLPDRIEFRKA